MVHSHKEILKRNVNKPYTSTLKHDKHWPLFLTVQSEVASWHHEIKHDWYIHTMETKNPMK